MQTDLEETDFISIIICVRNSEKYIEECLQSILIQTYNLAKLELSIYDDGSTDGSTRIITSWYECHAAKKNIRLIMTSNPNPDQPKGVGGAKNRAVQQSNGNFLCFLDSDDFMHPDRIRKQYEMCKQNPNCIIGCKIRRIPEDSTPRYINWANNLHNDQLQKQIYTCFGPTILMPTWFCTRSCYDKVGQFDETQAKGIPEDLIFFYNHLRLGGGVMRVDDVLLTYRYHPEATTFSVTDETIWKVRLKELEQNVLKNWTRFMIWNAGKEGRRLYRSLNSENRSKVDAFCDVDPKKISKKYYTYEDCVKGNKNKPRIPIIHFSQLKTPVIICVKLGLYNEFEKNFNLLNLQEGIDFIHFG